MGKIGNSDSNRQCCVPQCKSRSMNEISLFRFPKEESQRKKWTDAIKIEKGITLNMQVCSRHFVKNDYIISDVDGSKVRRLKRSAVPSQNLPWQFPNKRVSPTLAKARMERLKNRSQQKTSDSPVKAESPAKKSESSKKTDDVKKSEVIKKYGGDNQSKGDIDSEEDNKCEGVKKSKGDKKLEGDNKYEEDKKSEEKTSDLSDKWEDAEPKSEEMIEDDTPTVDNTSVDVKDEIEDTEEAIDENGGEDTEAKKDENNVTRAPTRLRQRTGVLKCEYCGRKCLTPQALQTHQQIAHKAKNNLISPKPKSPRPTPLISVRSPETLQQPKVFKALEKSLSNSEVEKFLEDEFLASQDQRKVEFECPKCKRRFSVFFMANRHIQKHHGGPRNGSKPPLLPKPTRLEICTLCNTSVGPGAHVCGGALKLAAGFICTGCEQEYKTLTLFDMHKSSRHNDGVESMFFPTLDEFQAWKQRMEIQTQAKYTILDQNDTKKIHRCTHRTLLGVGNNSRQRMCPSSIVVQEFTKGFQVHYYPNHHDHAYEQYNLSKAFKKYSISSLMNRTASKLPDSDDEPAETDLYLQFKKITNVLVTEAARVDVNGLKKLMRKALDMIAIVNSYVEDDDDEVVTSSIIKLDPDKDDLQDQVKEALLSLKRPSERIEATPVKRRKSVFQSTENTLKSKEVVRFTPVKETEKFEKKDIKVNQTPSFIDTFQDFVGKSIVKPPEKRKRQSDGKKSTVKTKIGQFKPKSPTKALSPKSPKTASPRNSGVKDIEYEVKEQENDCNILILKI